MISRLFIAAKPPRPKQVKTRLGATIGHDRATQLYRAFLRDLADRFATTDLPCGWFVPAGSWPEIRAVIGDGWETSPRVIQHGPNWGARQRLFFAQAADRGEARTVLIASDSPHLTVEVIRQAFLALEEHEVVLGPVRDGGYCLLGLRSGVDVLEGVVMSGPDVNREIESRCSRLGLRLACLEETFDVDQASDLDLLRALLATRSDLPATREALQ